MSDFKTLMQESYFANQNFTKIWRDWRSGKLKEGKRLKPHEEPKSVSEARNLFLEKNDKLFSLKIFPLERRFKENPTSSLDELIEFLSVDIPAFRCGYTKEVFLKWLKQTKFFEVENIKLQKLILEVCQTKSFRREFRRWCRLALKIADENFVLRLIDLSRSEDDFTKIKSKWMLEMIQQNRSDLRGKLNEN